MKPKPFVTDEIWAPIQEFPGYEVSDRGHVRGLDRFERTRKRFRPGIVLVQMRDRYGYAKVNLHRGRGVESQSVHKLVLGAFHGPKPPGTQALHMDGTKRNTAENLRWGTAAENATDRERHGQTNRGERHGRAVIVAGDAERIRDLRRLGLSHSVVAKWLGINQSTAVHVAAGRTWKHLNEAEAVCYR